MILRSAGSEGIKFTSSVTRGYCSYARFVIEQVFFRRQVVSCIFRVARIALDSRLEHARERLCKNRKRFLRSQEPTVKAEAEEALSSLFANNIFEGAQ
jgi:hypothetical protein